MSLPGRKECHQRKRTLSHYTAAKTPSVFDLDIVYKLYTKHITMMLNSPVHDTHSVINKRKSRRSMHLWLTVILLACIPSSNAYIHAATPLPKTHLGRPKTPIVTPIEGDGATHTRTHIEDVDLLGSTTVEVPPAISIHLSSTSTPPSHDAVPSTTTNVAPIILSPLEAWLLSHMDRWYKQSQSLKCPFLRRRFGDALDNLETTIKYTLIRRECW